MVTMLAVLFGVLFGVSSGTIAQAKGHGFLGWLFLGFIFGPFALVVVACMPSIEPVPVVLWDSVEEGEERICPYCRSWIPCAASICRFCLSDVKPDATSDLTRTRERK
jgi:hypothetical protein